MKIFDIEAIGLYARYHDAVPTPALKKQPKAARPSTSSSQHHSLFDSSSMEQLSSASISDFLGPAVDSPPSPQKLRELTQLTKQAKRASHLQRHHGHKTASSQSSSISSLTPSDRLLWDLALDNLSLVRNSSIRSNDSSTLSRDGPESIHNFGRGFFQRRGKSNRESSSRSSAASSVYSEDICAENTSAVAGKESIFPSFFSKRKPSSHDATPKRPHISDPFNFQHVAHTERDDAGYEAGIRTLEFGVTSRRLSRSLSPDPVRGRGINDGHVKGDSTRPPLVTRHAVLSSGPRRLLKHIRSQDQFRKSRSQAPPRPPRFPAQQLSGLSPFDPPPPPPRTSSRQSNYRDVSVTLDNLNSVVDIKCPTSSKIRQQMTFSPSLSREYSDEQQCSPTDEKRFSRIMAGARDSTWPLTLSTPLICSSLLPDVPEEEEEHHGLSRRSRLSFASSISSLRGSQSAPMLRCLAGSHRPESGTSDTLGALGIIEINRLVRKDPQSPVHLGTTPTRESWEDLIDYCYEHEAEADCDYQWDRPSLDISRESTTSPGTVPAPLEFGLESEPNTFLTNSRPLFSPTAPKTPSLSPATSNSSTQFETEAVTPNSIAPQNFSLPRGDGTNRPLVTSKDFKQSSGFSTFREAQIFSPSPSLCDYQQQMLQHQAEKQEHNDCEFPVETRHQSAFRDDAVLPSGNNSSFPLTGQRLSMSTTATDSTSRSNSLGRRGLSISSSCTILTRRTASRTSLGKMTGTFTDESGPLPTAKLTDVPQGEAEVASACHATQGHAADTMSLSLSTGAQ